MEVVIVELGAREVRRRDADRGGPGRVVAEQERGAAVEPVLELVLERAQEVGAGAVVADLVGEVDQDREPPERLTFRLGGVEVVADRRPLLLPCYAVRRAISSFARFTYAVAPRLFTS